jgi:LysM repeat protein
VNLNLRALTRNKPALIGVAGAAGLGAVVWWRRRQGGSDTGTTTTTGSGVQSQAGGGVFDSTGTDLATAIGNLGAGLQQQLQDYTNNLPSPAPLPAPKPAPAPKPTVPAPAPKPVPKPAPKPVPKPAPWPPAKWIVIPKGSNLTVLARTYKTTVAALLKLNPQVKNPNLIYAGAKLRVK